MHPKSQTLLGCILIWFFDIFYSIFETGFVLPLISVIFCRSITKKIIKTGPVIFIAPTFLVSIFAENISENIIM